MTSTTQTPMAGHAMDPSARGAALITGASRGIGRAIALALARDGFDIVVGYVASDDAASAVVSEIEDLGRQAVAIRADIRETGGVEALAAQAFEAFGTINVVVSNATGYPAGTTMEHFLNGMDASVGIVLGTALDNYRETYDARVLAFLALARATVPRMPAGGSLIALTSTGTDTYMPGYGPTGTAMAAVQALTRYLAVELGPRGIRVNTVSGGLVRTDAMKLMTTDVERLEESVARRTPLGRVGLPEDLAGVVAFLASESAGWVTGQNIVADGGHSLR